VAVAGAKQAQNEEEGGGADVSVDAGVAGLITRGIVTFNFSPRNLTQVTSTMKPGQDSMFGFSSVKRITLREGLY